MDEELASTLCVSTISVESVASVWFSSDEVSTPSRGDVAGDLVGLGEREARGMGLIDFSLAMAFVGGRPFPNGLLRPLHLGGEGMESAASSRRIFGMLALCWEWAGD